MKDRDVSEDVEGASQNNFIPEISLGPKCSEPQISLPIISGSELDIPRVESNWRSSLETLIKDDAESRSDTPLAKANISAGDGSNSSPNEHSSSMHHEARKADLDHPF
jgi:hypothetical protein